MLPGQEVDPAGTGSCTTKRFVISYVDSFGSVTVSGTSVLQPEDAANITKNQPNLFLSSPPNPHPTHSVRAKRPILLNILYLTL